MWATRQLAPRRASTGLRGSSLAWSLRTYAAPAAGGAAGAGDKKGSFPPGRTTRRRPKQSRERGIQQRRPRRPSSPSEVGERFSLDNQEENKFSQYLTWIYDERCKETNRKIGEAVSEISLVHDASQKVSGLLEDKSVAYELFQNLQKDVQKVSPGTAEKVAAISGRKMDGTNVVHQEILDRGRNVLRELGMSEWPMGEVTENNSSISPIEALGFFDKFVVDKLRVPTLAAGYKQSLVAKDPRLLHQNTAFSEKTGVSTTSMWPELYEAYVEEKTAPEGDLTRGFVKHHPATVDYNLRLLMKNLFGIERPHLSESILGQDDNDHEPVDVQQKDPYNPLDFTGWIATKEGKQEEYIRRLAQQGDRTAIDQVHTHKVVQPSEIRPPTTEEFLRHCSWVVFEKLLSSGDLPTPYNVDQSKVYETADVPFTTPDQIDPTVEQKREWVEPKRLCVLCGKNPPPLEPMNVPLLLHFVNTNGLIIPRRLTGTCFKHQRKVKRVVARAVAMGVLDYKNRSFNVHNPFMAKEEEEQLPEFEEYDAEELDMLKKQMLSRGASLMGTPHDVEDLEM